MTVAEQKVREESRRFRAALPGLLDRYAGRWVVFVNGQVAEDCDDEEEAYAAGVRRFGVKGGFVIAQVTEDAGRTVPLSASIFFEPR
jgi:hypothetical protein